MFTGNVVRIVKKTAIHFARKDFCREAINECADLSVLREHHTLPVVAGIILIVLSFVIVIPSFFIIGLIAAELRKPLIGIIGIPLAYGFSWLMLMLGMYLTGPEYAKALGKWVTRVMLEKILGDEAKKIASEPN